MYKINIIRKYISRSKQLINVGSLQISQTKKTIEEEKFKWAGFDYLD
jgi:hypothetical protein